jgi:hypothetical protein
MKNMVNWLRNQMYIFGYVWELCIMLGSKGKVRIEMGEAIE